MASRAFIMELEEKVIKALETVKELEKALSFETAGHTTACQKDNSDLWGTVGCNLSVLAAKSSKVYEKVQQARRMAENV